MGYMHISNLYKDQTILAFKECYALEKIHGTSAHLIWKDKRLNFFSGGEKYENFVALFDKDKLIQTFTELGHDNIVVFGEAYGGKQQKQSWRYGPNLKFVAFEVKIRDQWLTVPEAEEIVKRLGLEFVYYKKVTTELTALDAERDAPSEQAKRNGVEGEKPREGIVLRPLFEARNDYDKRIIAKHKRDEERETATPRKVVDPEKLAVLENAEAIATEWVTRTRLEHVLDKLGNPRNPEKIKDVIIAMIEDVTREGKGELVDTKEARKAIGGRAAMLYKAYIKERLYEENK